MTIKNSLNRGNQISFFAKKTYLYHRSRKAHLSWICLRFNVPEEDDFHLTFVYKKRRSKIVLSFTTETLKAITLLQIQNRILTSKLMFPRKLCLPPSPSSWIARQQMIRVVGD